MWLLLENGDWFLLQATQDVYYSCLYTWVRFSNFKKWHVWFFANDVHHNVGSYQESYISVYLLFVKKNVMREDSRSDVNLQKTINILVGWIVQILLWFIVIIIMLKMFMRIKRYVMMKLHLIEEYLYDSFECSCKFHPTHGDLMWPHTSLIVGSSDGLLSIC